MMYSTESLKQVGQMECNDIRGSSMGIGQLVGRMGLKVINRVGEEVKLFDYMELEKEE